MNPRRAAVTRPPRDLRDVARSPVGPWDTKPLLLGGGILAAAVMHAPALAADFTAGTEAELLQAITDANANAGIDRITVTGDVVLSGPLPTLNSITLIIGNGSTAGSLDGDVDLGSNSDIEFNRSDDFAFDGVISGIGGVKQSGAGTVTLSGVNSYVGGTIIVGGTIEVTNTDSLGLNIANNDIRLNGGTLALGAALPADSVFRQDIDTVVSVATIRDQTGFDGVVFSGDIVSSDGLVFTGPSGASSGAGVILEGNNRFPGGTDLAGAVELFGTTSSLRGTYTASGSNSPTTGLHFDQSFTGIFRGEINASAAQTVRLVVRGGGTVILQRANTGLDAILIEQGSTLRISAADQLDDASVQLDGPGTFPGSGTAFGSSVLHVTETLSTGAAIDVDGGELRVDAGRTMTVSGVTTYRDNPLVKTGDGTLRLNGGSIVMGAGPVAESLDLQEGTLILGNDNAAGGGTAPAIAANGGTLGYGNGVGIANTVTLGADTDLFVGAGDAATQTGSLAESDLASAVTKTGDGMLTLSGGSNHTGGTSVSAGTLRLGASERLDDGGALSVATGATFDLNGFDEAIGRLSGDGTLALGSGSLTAGGMADSVFSGTVTGTGGTLNKFGAGTLTFSGTGTHTGGTAVNLGTLIVDGSLGSVSIGGGALLGGSGTVGALSVSGRVAPGNSIGTLSAGSASFDPGSIFAVEIAADGSADLLDVTGAATLNGGSVEVAPLAGTYVDGQRYTLIRTGSGVAGTFDSVGFAAGQSIAFDLSLLYEGHDVLLELSRSLGFTEIVTPEDLIETAAALDALEADPPPAAGDVLDALHPLGAAGVIEGTRQLSGSGLAGVAQAASQASQVVLVAMQGAARQGGAPEIVQFAMAGTASGQSLPWVNIAPGRRPGAEHDLWIRILGGTGSRDADRSADKQSRYYAGATGGFVFPRGEDLEFGLAFSGLTGSTESDDGLASTDVTSFVAAARTGWSPGPWVVDGVLGLAHHSFESRRDLTFGGLARTARGERDGFEVIGDLAASYDWQSGAVQVTPFAGLTASWLYEEDWEETGAGGANLAFEDADTLSVQPRLGLGLSTDMALDGGLTLTPNAQALWIFELGDEASDYTARFVGTEPAWRVPSVDEPRHSAVIGLSADLVSDSGWSLSAGYAGRFSGESRDHGLQLEARFAF